MKLTGGLAAAMLVAAITVVLIATPISAACHIVTFSEPEYLAKETAGSVTITIDRRIVGNGCPGTINYTTEDDSAKQPSDYKKASGTLTYESTEASKSFTVEIVNDSEEEGDEAFKVTFTGSSPSPVSGTASVTIADDEQSMGAETGSGEGEVTTQEGAAGYETTKENQVKAAAAASADEGTPVGLIVAIAAGALVVIAGIAILLRKKPTT